MPIAVNKRKRQLNNSQHQKVQQSLVTLASQKSQYGKENYSPTPKSRTQNKLYSILNHHRAISPFTNRTVNNKDIISLINQSTNRVIKPFKQSHHSVGQRDAINIKINQMLETSVMNRTESVVSPNGDKVIFSLPYLSKLNLMEREKMDLRNIIKSKEDTISRLEQNIDQLNQSIQDQQNQIDSFKEIEEQVSELDRYCNELLVQNGQLKVKLSQTSDEFFQQLIKDMFTKCKSLEINLSQLSDTFQKCNKLTIMLYNHEELPMEMFINRLKKDSVQHTQDSNLLSPVEHHFTLIEYHQKVNDLIQFANYVSSQMLKKGQKTLQQVSQRFISNITNTYNSFSQY